jgi:hypothetical protein
MLKKNSHLKLNHGCYYFAFRSFSNPYAMSSCGLALEQNTFFLELGTACEIHLEPKNARASCITE